MRKELYSSPSLSPLPKHTSYIPLCGACGLFRQCQSPKMPIVGKGKREVLVLGEGPGLTEDQRNLPFVGRAGQRLRKALRKVDVDLDEDCWTTNSIICRAWKPSSTNHDGRANRPPTEKEIDFCRPNVLKAINTLKPKVIILLGHYAIRSVIGHLWRDSPGEVGRWVGWRIPCQVTNAWICPTYHPSHVMRREGGEIGEEDDPVLSMLFEEHLRKAFLKTRRPWDEKERPVPRIEVEYSPDTAAVQIHKFQNPVQPIAFDLECDRLKPDFPESRIVCCAISNGQTTIVYPWHGEAVKATAELLASDTPKIGWNAKYEIRWIRSKLGIWVNNWVWDGNLAAHILDNRSSITSLKFQAFVVLGQPPWDEYVKPFLQSKPDDERLHGGNAVNRIREADLGKLLRYCAWDSYLEWKMAMVQSKQLGIKI